MNLKSVLIHADLSDFVGENLFRPQEDINYATIILCLHPSELNHNKNCTSLPENGIN